MSLPDKWPLSYWCRCHVICRRCENKGVSFQVDMIYWYETFFRIIVLTLHIFSSWQYSSLLRGKKDITIKTLYIKTTMGRSETLIVFSVHHHSHFMGLLHVGAETLFEKKVDRLYSLRGNASHIFVDCCIKYLQKITIEHDGVNLVALHIKYVFD